MSSRVDHGSRRRYHASPSPTRSHAAVTSSRDEHELRGSSSPRRRNDRFSPARQNYQAEERTRRGFNGGRSPSPIRRDERYSNKTLDSFRTPLTFNTPPPPYSAITTEQNRRPYQSRSSTTTDNRREYRREAGQPASIKSPFEVPARRATVHVSGPIADRINRNLNNTDWRCVYNEAMRKKVEANFSSPLRLQNAGIAAIRERVDVLLWSSRGYGRTTTWMVGVLDALMGLRETPGVLSALVVAPCETVASQIGAQINLILPRDTNDKRLIAPSWCWQEKSRDNYYKELEQCGIRLAITSSDFVASLLADAPIDLSRLQFLILDDFDRIMEAQSEKWLNSIKSKLDPSTQLIVVNTGGINVKLAERVLFNNRYVEIRASQEEDIVPPRQLYCSVSNLDDAAAELLKILDGMEGVKRHSVVIFFESDAVMTKIHEFLRKKEVQRFAILTRRSRNQELWRQALNDFREGLIDILLASYKEERFIDSDRLLLDVYFQLPSHFEQYGNRLRRNGRMRTGHSITLLSVNDLPIFPLLYKERTDRGLPIDALEDIESKFRRQKERDEAQHDRSVKREQLMRELSSLNLDDEEAQRVERRAEGARREANQRTRETLLPGRV